MNRRSFLKALLCGAGAVVAAPFVKKETTSMPLLAEGFSRDAALKRFQAEIRELGMHTYDAFTYSLLYGEPSRAVVTDPNTGAFLETYYKFFPVERDALYNYTRNNWMSNEEVRRRNDELTAMERLYLFREVS